MSIATTILEQLGGGRFLAMTGCHHLVDDGRTLRMSIPRNFSKANRLYITLDWDDTYTMRFFYYRSGWISTKTGKEVEPKTVEIKTVKGVYFDMLEEIFTSVTGMYTRL